MRFLLKVLFAPVIAVLVLLSCILGLILRMSAWMFGILGTVFFVLGLLILLFDSIINGIIVIAFAVLVSPMGLPMATARMIGQLQTLRYFVLNTIYG